MDTALDLHQNNVLENLHFSPQYCKEKLTIFLQLEHQQEIPSISETKALLSISITVNNILTAKHCAMIVN
jgi:hypothetical protein